MVGLRWLNRRTRQTQKRLRDFNNGKFSKTNKTTGLGGVIFSIKFYTQHTHLVVVKILIKRHTIPAHTKKQSAHNIFLKRSKDVA
jgi:hypothetical protein